MKILNISRGAIKIAIDNKELVIHGEGMMFKSPPEMSEYVIYKNSLKWSSPDENAIISDVLKEEIFIFLEEELKKRNLIAIIE